MKRNIRVPRFKSSSQFDKILHSTDISQIHSPSQLQVQHHDSNLRIMTLEDKKDDLGIFSKRIPTNPDNETPKLTQRSLLPKIGELFYHYHARPVFSRAFAPVPVAVRPNR